MPEPSCVDCKSEGVTNIRHSPYGGPRSPLCYTHHNMRKKKKSATAHGQKIEKTFGITEDEYWALYEFQKKLVAEQGGTGVDPIDLKSTGSTKRLAVDHDHETGEIRGLLSGRSNYDLLGFHDKDTLLRAVGYLDDPPARKFFGGPRYVPEGA